MKSKFMELLPRAGALLAALVVLISSVAVPARAASTSEAVKYYDVTDYNMSGTISGGSTNKLTFRVSDYASLFPESYSYSDWRLLIVGQFDGTRLVDSYGATLLHSTSNSYSFKLSKDWIQNPSITVKQDNEGVTGRYNITAAYLINSTYSTKYDAYGYVYYGPWSFSSIYNSVFSFSKYSGVTDLTAQGVTTIVLSPQKYIPCTTLYFEFEIEHLLQDDFALSFVSLSSSSAVASETYDYDLRLLTTTGGYSRYGVEVTGPFTDLVFVLISFSAEGGPTTFLFDGFYAGFNRVLNSNSLLDWIRRETTQIRSYLRGMKDDLTSVLDSINSIASSIANGDLGSKPSTNIFDAWNGTISNLSNSFQSVVNAVNGIAGSVSKALASSFNSVTTAVNGIAGSVSTALASSFNSVTTAVSNVAGSVVDGLKSSIDSITTAVSSVAGSVVDGLKSSIDSITTAVEGITGNIMSGLPEIIRSILSPDGSYDQNSDLSDVLGNVSSSDDHYLDIFEDNIQDIENSVSSSLGASMIGSSSAGLGAAFLFVGNYVNMIWDGVPEYLVIVFTIPIVLGIYFFILSRFRVPNTRPEPGEYTVSETWTTSDTVRRHEGDHVISETHTTTRRSV